MRLNQDQIEAIRAAVPELAEQLEAGEKVTVELEVKRWHPQEGSFIVDRFGAVRRVDCDVFSNNGAARKTREAAERLSRDQRIFNRLHAYREEFAPGYVVPTYGEFAYHVYWSAWKEKYFADCMNGRSPEIVYMPQNVCEDLCRKLNSGEVVL